MGITGYIGVVLIVVAIVLATSALRRLKMLREGGVHVALRRRIDDSGRGWLLGVGRYRGDEFVWYRVLSVRSGPDQVIPRIGLQISDRRQPHLGENYAMPTEATVLRCRDTDSDTVVELAMNGEALTGFLSWLEAAPPGNIVPWAS
ncbi:MAG TPA: DUF2550 domain-containing protein [Pseudonocardiaceae bacterium]|nr:DUF2550 domain-containing protein [Pseudonocardiaceae bacterium]